MNKKIKKLGLPVFGLIFGLIALVLVVGLIGNNPQSAIYAKVKKENARQKRSREAKEHFKKRIRDITTHFSNLVNDFNNIIQQSQDINCNNVDQNIDHLNNTIKQLQQLKSAILKLPLRIRRVMGNYQWRKNNGKKGRGVISHINYMIFKLRIRVSPLKNEQERCKREKEKREKREEIERDIKKLEACSKSQDAQKLTADQLQQLRNAIREKIEELNNLEKEEQLGKNNLPKNNQCPKKLQAILNEINAMQISLKNTIDGLKENLIKAYKKRLEISNKLTLKNKEIRKATMENKELKRLQDEENALFEEWNKVNNNIKEISDKLYTKINPSNGQKIPGLLAKQRAFNYLKITLIERGCYAVTLSSNNE